MDRFVAVGFIETDAVVGRPVDQDVSVTLAGRGPHGDVHIRVSPFEQIVVLLVFDGAADAEAGALLSPAVQVLEERLQDVRVI